MWNPEGFCRGRCTGSSRQVPEDLEPQSDEEFALRPGPWEPARVHEPSKAVLVILGQPCMEPDPKETHRFHLSEHFPSTVSMPSPAGGLGAEKTGEGKERK